MEISHFTRNGKLYHAVYIHKAERGKISWYKLPGTEKPCDCSEREADRKALEEVNHA